MLCHSPFPLEASVSSVQKECLCFALVLSPYPNTALADASWISHCACYDTPAPFSSRNPNQIMVAPLLLAVQFWWESN